MIYFGCGYAHRIGATALEIIQNPEIALSVSRISFWEIAIKINIGKLHIPIGLKNVIEMTRQAGIEIVPIKDSHIVFYQTLEGKSDHKDPFDRYIISTAICEEAKIISSDSKFDLYGNIERFWD